jgi:uncharacterized membrane protein YphA (DoxX/SURF4 family)
MKRSIPFPTAAFLVLLRLVIGWQFLYEGVHKVQDDFRAETPTGEAALGKPFSSENYFREAPGPLGGFARRQMGDLDDEALARLTVRDVPADADPAAYPPYKRAPELVDKEWNDYLRRFEEHYELDDEQKALADAKLKQAEEQLVLWLTAGGDPVTKNYPTGTVDETLSTPERIVQYRAAVEELRRTAGGELWLFGANVEGPRLAKRKADVAEMRTALLKDLAVGPKTSAATGAEAVALNAAPSAGPLNSAATLVGGRSDLKTSLDDLLTKDQRAKGPVPEPKTHNLLWWLDRVTEWGLVVVGACLLLGLFTRTNCLLAAAFLLLTYLAWPPFPWLPAAPNTEGNPFFVNKNLVELVALLALATTASGRWFGLDAWLGGLWRALFGRRAPRAAGAGRRAA